MAGKRVNMSGPGWIVGRSLVKAGLATYIGLTGLIITEKGREAIGIKP